MITKLMVLNGTEGHKFEVGKQYANTDDVQTVEKITILANGGHRVWFVGNVHVDVLTENVLVFREL